jgi:hypothetical protein
MIRWWRRRRGATESPITAVDPETAAALKDFHQGDHIPDVDRLSVTASAGSLAPISTPDGAVVISQTCDVVLSSRLTVQLVPLQRLSGAKAEEARDGRWPRYAHLPHLGADAFADLEIIATVTKPALRGRRHFRGVVEDEDVRRFSLAVGRKFSRFAFPDDVVPWLRPLEEVALSKANRDTKPEGRAFAQVEQLRIESESGWDSPPYQLVLAVIVKPGVLPLFADDQLPQMPEPLRGKLYDLNTGALRKTSGEIAEMLDKTSDSIERYFLWMSLGEAWAAKCKPKGTVSPEIARAVTLRAEVVSADEYSLARVMRSETLDLDHLSPPRPE